METVRIIKFRGETNVTVCKIYVDRQKNVGLWCTSRRRQKSWNELPF